MVRFPAADGYWQPVLGLTFRCSGLGQVRQELLTQVTPNVESLLIQLKPNLLPRCWELVARRPCANTSPTCDQASQEGVCLQACTSKKKFFSPGTLAKKWDLLELRIITIHSCVLD